jgi:hypothetical protein
VIGILGHDHMRDQRLGRQAALDQSRLSRSLHHGAGAGPTGVFRPPDHQHAELERDHIQPLGDVLADPVELARAARAGPIGDIDHDFDPRQMRRQRPAVDLASADRSALLLRRRALFLGLGGGKALLEILERERQLIGIEPLRPAPEAVALQRDDDRPQPIALAPNPSHLRGMLGALGEEQPTQRFRIGREIVDVERHIVRFTAPAIECQTTVRVGRRHESSCRRLLRCLRNSDLDLSYPRPVEPLDQSRELRWRQAHRTILDPRPAEPSLLEPLGE